MSTSAARVIANRQNALKSTGPTTSDGKARSRTNALKHGLTGEAVAIPGEDVAAINHRFEAIEQALRPQGELARLLAHRVAALSVRLERSVRHESAFLAEKIRHAAERFDEARVDEANQMMAAIDSDPAGLRQKLERTPEGCDRLIEALLSLRRDLMNGGTVGDGDPSATRWSARHGAKLDSYLGHSAEDLTLSRCSDLTRALGGSIDLLSAPETATLDPQDLRSWARDRLADLIDAEVALLEAHRETIDHDAIDLDRSEAGTRALFDASPAAILARKYEATTERQLFRTLREFHEAQAVEAPSPAPQVPMAQHGPTASARPGPAPLGSFFPGEPRALANPSQPASSPSHRPEIRESRPVRPDFYPVEDVTSIV